MPVGIIDSFYAITGRDWLRKPVNNLNTGWDALLSGQNKQAKGE